MYFTYYIFILFLSATLFVSIPPWVLQTVQCYWTLTTRTLSAEAECHLWTRPLSWYHPHCLPVALPLMLWTERYGRRYAKYYAKGIPKSGKVPYQGNRIRTPYFNITNLYHWASRLLHLRIKVQLNIIFIFSFFYFIINELSTTKENIFNCE